jgi:uncharacterized protein (DUF2147 family)
MGDMIELKGYSMNLNYVRCWTAVFVTLLLSAGAMAAKKGDIVGQWYSENNESKILIREDKGVFTGKIISLDEPLYPKGDKEAGKPKRDRENPDRKRRKVPIVGLQILKDFKFNASEQSWEDGTIYDPDKGKIYKCVMKFEKDPKAEGGVKLYVRGYVGIPALGRTTYWTKVPEKELEKVKK